jgi:hypothetical protein
MVSRKLIQSMPDYLIADGDPWHLVLQETTDIGHDGSAVALFPNQRGCLVKRVGFVPLAVIHQQLPR